MNTKTNTGSTQGEQLMMMAAMLKDIYENQTPYTSEEIDEVINGYGYPERLVSYTEFLRDSKEGSVVEVNPKES